MSDKKIENVFQLDGQVPLKTAIPFGLQHVLAMFVANLSPIAIICAAAQPALSTAEIAIHIRYNFKYDCCKLWLSNSHWMCHDWWYF